MYHKKRKHRVSECKTNITGTCWFGEEKCWFAHYEIKENDENGKNDRNENDRNENDKTENDEENIKTMK